MIQQALIVFWKESVEATPDGVQGLPLVLVLLLALVFWATISIAEDGTRVSCLTLCLKYLLLQWC